MENKFPPIRFNMVLTCVTRTYSMQCLYNGNSSMAPINLMSPYQIRPGTIAAVFQLKSHQNIEPENMQ